MNSIFQKIKKILLHDRISLCLHIGMPKTGTTAIQHFLAQNRETLARNGTLYPKCGNPEFQHAALVKSIVSKKYPWAKFNDAIDCFDPINYIDRVVEECRQRRCSRVVLSSEFFWAAPAMQSDLPYHLVSEKNLGYLDDFVCQCKELFSVFDTVQIVVYLRRQDEWLDSFFGQQVKEGFSIPEQQQLLDPRVYLLYSENLKLWSSAFGKENIVVKVYDEQVHDVIADFCHLADFHSPQFVKTERDAENVNTRLTPLAAEIMQKALALNIDSTSIVLLKDILKRTSFALITQNRQRGVRTFSKEFLDNIRTVYFEDTQKLKVLFPEVAGITGTAPANLHEKVYSESPCPEQDMQQLIANLIALVEDNTNITK